MPLDCFFRDDIENVIAGAVVGQLHDPAEQSEHQRGMICFARIIALSFGVDLKHLEGLIKEGLLHKDP